MNVLYFLSCCFEIQNYTTKFLVHSSMDCEEDFSGSGKQSFVQILRSPEPEKRGRGRVAENKNKTQKFGQISGSGHKRIKQEADVDSSRSPATSFTRERIRHCVILSMFYRLRQ